MEKYYDQFEVGDFRYTAKIGVLKSTAKGCIMVEIRNKDTQELVEEKPFYTHEDYTNFVESL